MVCHLRYACCERRLTTWSWFWGGVKNVRAASKNRKEYDVEIGQGTFQEMRQLQGEIDVIKDRLLVAQGESLGRVVRDRLGSGGVW